MLENPGIAFPPEVQLVKVGVRTTSKAFEEICFVYCFGTN